MKQKFSTQIHSQLHTCCTRHSTRSVRLYYSFIIHIA